MTDHEDDRDTKKKELLKRFKLIRDDPIEFAKAVYTLDEVDKENPIKRFPIHLKYIQLYIRVWQKYPKIVVPKSRRMKMSWTNIMLYTWDTMFHAGRHNAIVSKKEDDADFLIKERAKFIIDHLDPEIIPKELVPKYEYRFCKLEFPEINSKLWGFPQGADQARQYTLSGLMADEFAFWEKAEDTYSSSKPTLDGGGRFTGVSSPAPGFFKRLVLDKLDSTSVDDLKNAEIISNRKHPMEGVELWTNPINGFTVYQIHFKADPYKRTKEFEAETRKGMPLKKWSQEYDLKWESFAGLPVYPDFRRDTHGIKESVRPHIGLPLLRGWDFALMPACIIAQLQEDKLVVLKEIVGTNIGADRFSDIVIQQCRQIFPQWSNQEDDYLDFVDPSGFGRKDTDEKTCASILAGKGLRPAPGAMIWETRRKSVEDYLTKSTNGTPCFRINIDECPTLMRGFEGGYRYADSTTEIEPTKIRPIKDEHSHPHDALQMITSRLNFKKRVGLKKRIPRQSYSFSK